MGPEAIILLAPTAAALLAPGSPVVRTIRHRQTSGALAWPLSRISSAPPHELASPVSLSSSDASSDWRVTSFSYGLLQAGPSSIESNHIAPVVLVAPVRRSGGHSAGKAAVCLVFCWAHKGHDSSCSDRTSHLRLTHVCCWCGTGAAAGVAGWEAAAAAPPWARMGSRRSPSCRTGK